MSPLRRAEASTLLPTPASSAARSVRWPHVRVAVPARNRPDSPEHHPAAGRDWMRDRERRARFAGRTPRAGVCSCFTISRASSFSAARREPRNRRLWLRTRPEPLRPRNTRSSQASGPRSGRARMLQDIGYLAQSCLRMLGQLLGQSPVERCSPTLRRVYQDLFGRSPRLDSNP